MGVTEPITFRRTDLPRCRKCGLEVLSKEIHSIIFLSPNARPIQFSPYCRKCKIFYTEPRNKEMITSETGHKQIAALDYNDQCDIAFGRLSRLVAKEPELMEHLTSLSAVDLNIDDLGLSGVQVEMVIDALRSDIVVKDEDGDGQDVKGQGQEG